VPAGRRRAPLPPRPAAGRAGGGWGRQGAGGGGAPHDVPGAWTTLDGTELKIFRPRPLPAHDHGAEPGTVLHASKVAETGIRVACGTGAVEVREVTPSGKRRMLAADWVRGRGVAQGDRLE
jgi:methionyl-tRNA formyltransferase